MDRPTGIFVDGIAAAAAISGILSGLQGRIFGLLYLRPEPLSLDDIANELGQSKSNVSIQIRGLGDWHLVQRVHVPGSRRDHYEAATDLVRVMQEIIERRFRWNIRQVLAAAEDAGRVTAELPKAEQKFVKERLEAIDAFFHVLDTTAEMLSPGKPFPPGQGTTPAAGGNKKSRR